VREWPVAWIATTVAAAFISSWWLHALVEKPVGRRLDAWWRARK
jgi:peptidoglycan/LPS O-acetylase OafA/YrhL